MYRVRVAPVASSSRLSSALSPGQAREYGEYDPSTRELRVVDAETATRLVETCHNVSWGDGAPDTPAEADADGSDGAPAGPTCAGTKTNGEPCTREVDEPGAYCWQHA